jgi:transcriptional regulator with XRE-family HTH domain
MIPVNEKLAIMRESERMNRKEFSDLTGVPYSSLSSYEKGKRYGHTSSNEDFESSSVQKIHDVVHDRDDIT